MINKFKLRAVHFRDLQKLLKDVGLVNGQQGFPSNIFVCKEDYKKITKEITKQFKKQHPHITKRRLEFGVGMHMLDLAPAINDAIKPGYAIIVPILTGEKDDNGKTK